MYTPVDTPSALVEGCDAARQRNGDPEPSKLKEALDEALTHTQALRQLLVASATQKSPGTVELEACSQSPRSVTDSATQTDPSRAASPPRTRPLATPTAKAHAPHTHLLAAGTPGLASPATTPFRAGGVIEAAVQQACRTLLTPQPRTASRSLMAQPGGGVAPHNTPLPCSAAAPGGSRLPAPHHHPETPLAELSLAPFGAYQHAKEAQESRQRATTAAPGAADAGGANLARRDGAAGPSSGCADAECNRRLDLDDSGRGPFRSQVTAAKEEEQEGHAQVVDCALKPSARAPVAPPAPAVASWGGGVPASESVEPCFTPNTTTVRLRAAMQWMQLQLQVSPGLLARPRRYSDSSVSPALKILGGGEQGGAAAHTTAMAAAAGDGAPDALEAEVVAGPAAVDMAQPQRGAGLLLFDECGLQQENGAGQGLEPTAAQSGSCAVAAAVGREAAEVAASGEQAPAAAAAAAVGKFREAATYTPGAAVGQAPLRDVSGAASNVVRLHRPEQEGQGKQQLVRPLGLAAGAGAAGKGPAEVSAPAAGQRPEGRRRFGLRW